MKKTDYDLPSFIKQNIKIDEIKTFWIVTYPNTESEMIDICFECTIPKLMLQTLGGLKIKDIAGIFKEKEKAEETAEYLIKNRNTFKEI